MLRSHIALVCAVTALVLGMLSVQVSSMQSVVGAYQPVPDPFKLKNPNAFDPARRRAVRAMKEPRETAELLAIGIDAAEAPDETDGRDRTAAASAEPSPSDPQ